MVDLPAPPARSDLFPPPSFPVYGLISPFDGARCLELFGDPPDGEPHWMSLWHQSADERSVIMMTTYTRRAPGNSNSWRVPTDEQAAQHGVSPLESLASQCTTTLVDLTLPVLSQVRLPGFLKALVGHARAAAEAYADWATVDWRVDGIAARAPTWSFAGGWAGFTDAAEGVYVSVVGLGPGARPEGLALAALRDSEAYHFDLYGPLSLEVAATSREAAGVPYEQQPPWRSTEWHPDLLQLIGQLGSDPAE
jgi:hypothetical protein